MSYGGWYLVRRYAGGVPDVKVPLTWDRTQLSSDPQENDDSRMATTPGTIESQDSASLRVTVTKSPVMNTDSTPGMFNTAATRSSAVAGSVNVAGPPTGVPTVNFMARGFGVFSTTTATTTFLMCCVQRSGRAT